MRSNKFWFISLGGVVIVSAIITLLLGQMSTSRAHIYQNGTLVNTVDLNAVTEPYTITVVRDGGTNIVAVEHGRIRILTADCPSGMCVRRGWISGGVTPIICLPHRLVITLVGGDDSGIDAVVG